MTHAFDANRHHVQLALAGPPTRRAPPSSGHRIARRHRRATTCCSCSTRPTFRRSRGSCSCS